VLSLLRNLFRPSGNRQGFTFSRPLVVIQSDDWGRVGVRDREGYEQLRANGLSLGEHPYDFYTLETADDVNALAALLAGHKDSTGREPCLVMNFCTANLDFPSMREGDYKALKLLPLAQGLPGKWSRPGLFEAYRAGIAQGVFYPALHGMAHCCPIALEEALVEEGERADLLHTFWKADAPYIFWRMPWVGYEYWNPAKPRGGFLPVEKQEGFISQATKNFVQFFVTSPNSACAPGFRANRNTHFAWSQLGIHVAESGTGSGLRPPHMDEFGVLHLYRTIDFEPSQREVEIDKHLELARNCFSRGLPLIISVHSINFHSTLKDFRSSTIRALDNLLTALESRYPDLLYVHDADMYEIVTAGAFRSHRKNVSVTVRREEWNPRLAPQAAV
jgi:hypothetical protein